MTISFSDFISQLISSPPLMITVVLMLGVILVNGWTDAPNSIATCVATRSLSPKKAIFTASIMNFLGVLVMSLANATVAATIYKMVDFGGDNHSALVAMCAAMFAIVSWAVAAWWFGIPTSESHALIAGLSGAAIALQNGLGGINTSEWVKVLYGLVLSVVLGFGSGWLFTKLIEAVFRSRDRRKVQGVLKNAQIGTCMTTAFMHGAQDGQKFMAVFMLSIFLAKDQSGSSSFALPIWLMLLCSAIMALGTSIGGMRIIKSVGMDMVKLEKYQGFAADLAATTCLLLFSVTGTPVSTTHTKTTAIMGVGASRRLSSINWGIVRELILAWLLTFPLCGLISFIMAKVFLYFF